MGNSNNSNYKESVNADSLRNFTYGAFGTIELVNELANVDKLKCKFLYQDGHPMLIIYDGCISKLEFNSMVTRIDLVYDKDDTKKSVVRCETQSYGALVKRKISSMEIGKKEFVLSKRIGDVINFCKEYQDDYPKYSKMYHNCRKFMTLLSVCIGIENNDNWAAEDLGYAAVAFSQCDTSGIDLAKHAFK
eukprot:150934_1